MLRTYPAFVPCSATSQKWFPIRPSPTGVRRGFPVFRPFEQRISGQRQTQRKRELDRRVQKIFLKRVNDLMLHFRDHLAASWQLRAVDWRERDSGRQRMHQMIDVLLRDAQGRGQLLLKRSSVGVLFAPVPDGVLDRERVFGSVLARCTGEIPAPGAFPGLSTPPIPRGGEKVKLF